MSARGTTLVELVVFTMLGVIILLSIGSFYLSAIVSYDQGSVQASVQRQGTLLQQELARQILPAISVRPWGCGPGGVGLAVQRPADFICLYLREQRIFQCTIAPESFANPTNTDCVGTARDLLQGSLIPLRADSLTFNRGVGGQSVDIIFTLTEEALNYRIVVDPMEFTMGLRLRNS
jgi:hypothetical protein